MAIVVFGFGETDVRHERGGAWQTITREMLAEIRLLLDDKGHILKVIPDPKQFLREMRSSRPDVVVRHRQHELVAVNDMNIKPFAIPTKMQLEAFIVFADAVNACCREKQIPVLCMTARHYHGADAMADWNLYISNYIIGPFDAEQLVLAIEQLIYRRIENMPAAPSPE